MKRDEVRAKVEMTRTLDDMGYGPFVERLCKEMQERAETKDEPSHGRLVRGHFKQLNGVVRDDHMTVIWEGDDIAGFAIAVRDDWNNTHTITVDLTAKDEQ